MDSAKIQFQRIASFRNGTRYATKGVSLKGFEMIEIQEEVVKEANKIIAEEKPNCEDRGEGFKPRHVYLEGSTICVCGQGPDLMKERMR